MIPVLRGAAGLLGRECIWVAEAGPQAATAQQLCHGLPHFTAAQGVDDGVQGGVEDSEGDANVSSEQLGTLARGTEEVHQ